MMNETIFELPCYDSRKSFYGKAIVHQHEGYAELFSYGTLVAVVYYNLPQYGKRFERKWRGYSATTMRHVNSFLHFFGVDGGGKAWWDAQEVR